MICRLNHISSWLSFGLPRVPHYYWVYRWSCPCSFQKGPHLNRSNQRRQKGLAAALSTSWRASRKHGKRSRKKPWRLPKMKVCPNHPKGMTFKSWNNHGDLGIPHFEIHLASQKKNFLNITRLGFSQLKIRIESAKHTGLSCPAKGAAAFFH